MRPKNATSPARTSGTSNVERVHDATHPRPIIATPSTAPLRRPCAARSSGNAGSSARRASRRPDHQELAPGSSAMSARSTKDCQELVNIKRGRGISRVRKPRARRIVRAKRRPNPQGVLCLRRATGGRRARWPARSAGWRRRRPVAVAQARVPVEARQREVGQRQVHDRLGDQGAGPSRQVAGVASTASCCRRPTHGAPARGELRSSHPASPWAAARSAASAGTTGCSSLARSTPRPVPSTSSASHATAGCDGGLRGLERSLGQLGRASSGRPWSRAT